MCPAHLRAATYLRARGRQRRLGPGGGGQRHRRRRGSWGAWCCWPRPGHVRPAQVRALRAAPREPRGPARRGPARLVPSRAWRRLPGGPRSVRRGGCRRGRRGGEGKEGRGRPTILGADGAEGEGRSSSSSRGARPAGAGGREGGRGAAAAVGGSPREPGSGPQRPSVPLLPLAGRARSVGPARARLPAAPRCWLGSGPGQGQRPRRLRAAFELWTPRCFPPRLARWRLVTFMACHGGREGKIPARCTLPFSSPWTPAAAAALAATSVPQTTCRGAFQLPRMWLDPPPVLSMCLMLSSIYRSWMRPWIKPSKECRCRGGDLSSIHLWEDVSATYLYLLDTDAVALSLNRLPIPC